MAKGPAKLKQLHRSVHCDVQPVNLSMRTILIASILSLSALGCGESFEIADQPLQGQVGGASWSFVKGDTNAFLSDEDGYFATLFAEDYEACGFSQGAGNSLILSIPTAKGDYDLGFQRNMTFVVDEDGGPQNLVATEGRIVVDEITATTITGGIHARFDSDNEIDGTFTVSICSE